MPLACPFCRASFEKDRLRTSGLQERDRPGHALVRHYCPECGAEVELLRGLARHRYAMLALVLLSFALLLLNGFLVRSDVLHAVALFLVITAPFLSDRLGRGHFSLRLVRAPAGRRA